MVRLILSMRFKLYKLNNEKLEILIEIKGRKLRKIKSVKLNIFNV